MGCWTPPWRRPADDGVGWIAGEVAIVAAEVTFTDHPEPPQPATPSDAAPLAEDLAASSDFLARLRDDRFARALQLLLSEAPVVRLADGAVLAWTSGRAIGDMIAGLRDVGEGDHDIWLWEDPPEPVPRAEVVAALAALGWRPATDEEAERMPMFRGTAVVDPAAASPPPSEEAVRRRVVPAADDEIITLAEILWDDPVLNPAFTRCGVDADFTAEEQSVLDAAIDRFRSGTRQDRDLLHLWLAEGLCRRRGCGEIAAFDGPWQRRFLARRKVVRDPVEILPGGMWWATCEEISRLIHALCQDEQTRLAALRRGGGLASRLSADDAALAVAFVTRYARRHSLMNIAPLEVAIRRYPSVVCGESSIRWPPSFDHRKDGPGWIGRFAAPGGSAP
jgi:hypothetical protein